MPIVKDWPQLQLEDAQWIRRELGNEKPKILFYCHAVCDVAKCEADPDWAYEVNIGNLERVLEVLPAQTRLVYLSSDHVFGGNGVYTEETEPCPISAYGRTRVAAEQLVLQRDNALAVRVGVAIGASPEGRTGHLDWLRYRAAKNLPITIIEDEYRSIARAEDFSMRLFGLTQSVITGLRHIATTRAMSRVELAQYLIKTHDIHTEFSIEQAEDQPVPHLGRVELQSIYEDELGQPLPAVCDRG